MEPISVTRLNTYIKQIFDAEEMLHNIPVLGEIFGVNITRNVVYFSLKDENATLPCVSFYPDIFKNISEGDKVVVTGSPNFYAKVGKFNFNVTNIQKTGLGKLYEEFLRLKEKLEKKGLFSQEHKKKIPENIKRIGVITSKEGAVLQDIKNVVWRRDPSIDIVLYNTKVQGHGTENEIAHAIEKMGEYPFVDCIIVARGGGSLEDLWAYNTEVVAMATYNCPKPIISAVGHETDFTIIDFVSDLRAPTPSAGAELLTKDSTEKKKEVTAIMSTIAKISENKISKYLSTIELSFNTFIHQTTQSLALKINKMKNLTNNMLNVFESYCQRKDYYLSLSENTLKNIDPNKILSKGYAKIEQNQKSVKNIKSVNMNDEMDIFFIDGQLKVMPKEKGD